MGYLVRITNRAQRDLSALYGEINAESSTAARKWYGALNDAILTLEQRPYSWPATHESRRLRHIIYGRKPHRIYRVIYKVVERKKLVDVLHVRHGSRREFKPSELK